LAVGFCLRNLAFAPKIMALPEYSPQPPGLYDYVNREITTKTTMSNTMTTTTITTTLHLYIIQRRSTSLHFTRQQWWSAESTQSTLCNVGSMSCIRQMSPKPFIYLS